jgi:hypothetical protein
VLLCARAPKAAENNRRVINIFFIVFFDLLLYLIRPVTRVIVAMFLRLKVYVSAFDDF